MTLDESFTFKIGKRLSVLVVLRFPHTAHIPPIGIPETADLLGVVGKMGVQDEPVRRNGILHGRNLPAAQHPCANEMCGSYVPAGYKANSVRSRTLKALTQTLTLAYGLVQQPERSRM